MRWRIVVPIGLVPWLCIAACADDFTAIDSPSEASTADTGSADAPTAEPPTEAGSDAADAPALADVPMLAALAPAGTLHAPSTLLDVVAGNVGAALFAFEHALGGCTLPACADFGIVYETDGFAFFPPLAADPTVSVLSIPALQDSTGSNEFLAFNNLGSMNYKVRDFDVLSSCLGGSYIRMGVRDSVDAKVYVKSLKKPTTTSGGIDDPAVVRAFARADLDVKVPIACDGDALYYANPDDHILYSSRFYNVDNTSESRTPITPAADVPITALDQHLGMFVYAAGPNVYACTPQDAGTCIPQLVRTLPDAGTARTVTAAPAWLVDTATGSFVELCSTVEGCTPVRLGNVFAKTAFLVRGNNSTYVIDAGTQATGADGSLTIDYPIYRLPKAI